MEHLRALTLFALHEYDQAAAEPTATAGVRFLLAYHCLMLHQVDAAREALTNTRQLQPENQLVPRLLASLPPSVD